MLPTTDREPRKPRPARQLIDMKHTHSGASADASLIDRLCRHDEHAYEALVRAESGHLLAVARRLLRNEEDAQDAVQQAFLLAFRALPEFNGRCRLSTWLHRIVTNTALMKIRSRQRRPESSIDELLPRYLEDGHHAVQVRDWSDGADAQLERREVRDRVRAAVHQLPESYRSVLVLRDIEDVDTGETARRLGLSNAAVKTRLHRARQALATLLAPVFESSPDRLRAQARLAAS